MMRRTRKRVVSFLLVLTMVGSLLPQLAWGAEPVLQEGSGTKEDPYLLDSPEDLYAFRDLVNGTPADEGENPKAALCAYVTQDIDLENEPWERFYPADGYASSAFAGIFDGGGNTIRGLYVDETQSHQGLFGWVNGGVIRNLTVEGSVSSTANYVGGLVGELSKGSIENCAFFGDVVSTSASGNVGGLVGRGGSLSSASEPALISGCTASGTVSGNTAGGIIGYGQKMLLTDCYTNTEVDGDSRAGGIAGNLQKDVTAQRCFALGTDSGTIENCGKFSDAEGLLSIVGNRFIMDEALDSPWPVLDWQAGKITTPPEEEQAGITIQGKTTLYDTNGGQKPETTLTVHFTGTHEDTLVNWTLLEGEEIVTIEPLGPKSLLVQAIKPGYAKVQATAGTYEAKATITVLPMITVVEMDGDVAVGQAVTAKAYVLGGDIYDETLFPPLQVQWRVLSEEDYLAGNTGSEFYTDIPGATGSTLRVSEDLAGDYLSFSCVYGAETFLPSRPVRIQGEEDGVLAADAAALTLPEKISCQEDLFLPLVGEHGAQISWKTDRPDVILPDGTVMLPEKDTVVTLTAILRYEGAQREKTFTITVLGTQSSPSWTLEEAASSLGPWYQMTPQYGIDQNVNERLAADLAGEGFSGITVTMTDMEERYGGAGLDADGAITYYYTDPNTVPGIPFGQYTVWFQLEKEGDTLAFGPVTVTIGWDQARVEETIRQEILPELTLENLLAAGDTASSVTKDITLPQAIAGKTWAKISWNSSDDGVLSIYGPEEEEGADLFSTFVGKVHPGETAKEVTLTATVDFAFAYDTPLSVHQAFELTVLPLDGEQTEAIRQELREKLEKGFASKGLRDDATGVQLTPTPQGYYVSSGDIQLPTTRDFGVDGQKNPITLFSSDQNVLSVPEVKNAARVEVYRPGVGQEDKIAILTVTLTDGDSGIAASKEFSIAVPALTQEEVDAERQLMEKVKESYFDGLNQGANAGPNDVREDLTPFYEVYQNDQGELVWVREEKEKTGHGIVPTPIEGWQDLEAWRLFRSSHPAVIAHETLEVTRQAEPKAVTITSYLSSETLGRYGALYLSDPVQYAQYAGLEDLYYQETTAVASSNAAALPGLYSSASKASLSGTTVLVRGTKNPENTVPVVENVDVTFSLTGPQGAWIMPVTVANLPETSSVYDVFRDVLSASGYHYTRERGTYIVSITTPGGVTVAEKDFGENAGWLYRVNGKIPDVYMASQGLRDGDVIEVFYSKDYTQEDGYENEDSWADEGPSAPGGSAGGSVSEEVKPEETSGQTATTEDTPTSSVTVTYNEADKTYLVTMRGNGTTPCVVYLPAQKEAVPLQVWPNGTEEVVKKSCYRDGAVVLLLEQGAVIRLAEPIAVYTDVQRQDWYADDVTFMTARKLMTGVAEGTFAPNAKLSRAMLVSILYRLEEPEEEVLHTVFSDVDEAAWYGRAVAWAAEAGLVSGYADGRFGPDDPITREQLASILWRYAQYLSMSTGGRDTLRSFTDAQQISPWAQEAVAWAVDSGILHGRTDGTLDPARQTTRAEAAVMIRQMIEYSFT